MRAGESLRCSFDLNLRLAEGTFYVSAYVHRYLTSQALDRWISAATFFVAGAPTVRGVVDLEPHLAACDIRSDTGDRLEGTDLQHDPPSEGTEGSR